MMPTPTTVPMTRRIRTVVAVVLVLHAAIHLLAPADRWGWMTLDEPVAPTVSLSAAAQDALAAVWLGAAVLLVIAAAILLRRSTAWRWWAIAGIVTSQALTILWWQAAGFATVANLIILAAVLSDRTFGLTRKPQPADLPPCCRNQE